MYKILIVEDDRAIAQAIREKTTLWGMDARCVQDFRNVLAEFSADPPHLVLMDIGLPFFNGYYWCGELRKISRVPILFLSSASDNMNIVMAINMGADDFIAKPFDWDVLMAKLQALLRRSYDFAADAPTLTHRGAFLHTDDHTLTYRDSTVSLTKNEYRILDCLLRAKHQVVSRERLMKQLWETDLFVDENTLTVNVNRLRKKLDSVGLTHFITTKVGEGYLID